MNGSASVFLLIGLALALLAALLFAFARIRALRYQLNAVLEAVDDGITLQDAEGNLIYANETAAKVLGYVKADALRAATLTERLQHFSMFDEEGQPLSHLDTPGRRLLAGKTAEERLVRFHIESTGEDIWNALRAHPVRDPDGNLLFVVQSMRNVTQTRMLEDAQRTAQQWFATTLSSIGDAVIATDREGAVTFMNPVAETLTGWPVDMARGKPLSEVFVIVNEQTRLTVQSPVDKVLAEGIVVGLANHTLLLQRGGGETAIDDSAAPIADPQGALVGVVLVFRDVSQKRNEEEHRGFIARATAELASSVDYEVTLQKVVQLAVPEMADWAAVDLLEDGVLTRLSVAHRDPRKVEMVQEIRRRFPVQPENDIALKIATTGKPMMMTEVPADLMRSVARNEEHAQLLEALDLRSFVGVPLFAGKNPIGVMSFVMAESKRHYGETHLALLTTLADRASVAIEHARLFREAARANRTKDEFLAILGHELRNPLAPIMTALHLLQARDGPTRELTIIDRQLKHVVRLVDDLLDVSRIARGKIELEKEPVELAAVIATAVEMSQPLFASREHVLDAVIAPSLRVSGDRVRLAQVFANLLNNAAKYTPKKGRVQIHAEQLGEEIHVRITDSGMGMSAELLPRIFDMFTQSIQSIDRAEGGLGLGLTIVRSLLELHGGTVSATSAGLGKGSEITVRLPALGAAVASEPQRPVRLSTAKPKILVVDDNVDAAELLSEALQMTGYDVTFAHDGPSALALAEKELPVIGLLDIGLPGMDGYELAQLLLASPTLKGIKLIALTGYGQVSDRERSATVGFSAHLVKPISLKEVQAAVVTLLDAAR